MGRWHTTYKIILIFTALDLASARDATGGSIVIKVGCFYPVISSSNPFLQGAHFFYENGTQFFIRGIEYHDYHKASPSTSTYIDLLADNSVCTRDIPHLLRLGINTLFVTNTDPRQPHSGCMRLLQDAGIYVIVNPFNRIGISSESLPTWDNGSFPLLRL